MPTSTARPESKKKRYANARKGKKEMRTMDIQSRDYYRKMAQAVKDGPCDIDAVLGTDSVAHLLCEAERASPLGRGGDAFRCWYAGLFRNGVYLYAHNYEVGIAFCTDPTSNIHNGIMDSRCYGDAWPHPDRGELRRLHRAPAEIVPAIKAEAAKLLAEAAGIVLAVCDKWDATAREQQAAREADQDAVTANWKAVK
jgi:hypothetical protein